MEPSKSFSLNSLDWTAIYKGAFVALSGVVLTLIPTLMGFSYTWHGYDYTVVAVFVFSNIANILRKFVADNS